MPDLKRIQDGIDHVTKTIDELAALLPVTPEALYAIKDKAEIWKQDTYALLTQERHLVST